MQNLPSDLLRTFVAVADTGGITSASDVVGRSQPAVSLQIKRLEALVGGALLVRTGRTLHPTEDGRVLLQYARQILALNDAAVARLTRPKLAGCVRLGVPNEFASSFLPEVLGKFAHSHPDVALEVSCDLSTNLVARMERDELDLVFALHRDRASAPAGNSWTEHLSWVAGPKYTGPLRSPVPLIVAPEGCVYRARIIESLTQASRPWRVVYSCPSFGGIRAGVLAGLGVTVLATSIVPDGMAILNGRHGLPTLKPVQIRLHYRQDRASEAVVGLVEYMSLDLAQRRKLEPVVE